MYEVLLDGETLWYPGNSKYCLTEAVIHGELNASGYFDMTVPKTSPLYSRIESGVNNITILKNGNEYWTGIVQDVTIDFSGSKSVYVVGVMSFLLRTVQPQHNFLAMVGSDTSDITYYSTKRKIIEYVLNQHNSQIENGKRFYVGTIDASIGNEYYELNMDFNYTLDVLKQLTSDSGYYRIRKRTDGNYWLDFVTIENYGKRSQQEIRFASNLLEYKNKVSGIDICTAILPLGEKLENSDVPGMDAYLRINSVNGGLDYITDPAAVAKYGLIKKYVKFEGVTDASTLLSKARAYLNEYKTGYLDFTLTAIDMSMLNANIDDYDVGDYVHCICESLDTDIWLPVQTKDTDLLNLSNNKVNISKTPRVETLTKAAVTLAPAINENSVLEQANDYASDYADSVGEECNEYAEEQAAEAEGNSKKYAEELVSAVRVECQYLIAESAQILNAQIGTLSAQKANISDLTSATARITNLEATKITTDEVNAKVVNMKNAIINNINTSLQPLRVNKVGVTTRTLKSGETINVPYTLTGDQIYFLGAKVSNSGYDF